MPVRARWSRNCRCQRPSSLPRSTLRPPNSPMSSGAMPCSAMKPQPSRQRRCEQLRRVRLAEPRLREDAGAVLVRRVHEAVGPLEAHRAAGARPRGCRPTSACRACRRRRGFSMPSTTMSQFGAIAVTALPARVGRALPVRRAAGAPGGVAVRLVLQIGADDVRLVLVAPRERLPRWRPSRPRRSRPGRTRGRSCSRRRPASGSRAGPSAPPARRRRSRRPSPAAASCPAARRSCHRRSRDR